MKKTLFSVATVILLSCSAEHTESALPVKKSVFVIIDGVPADILERAYVPNINEISIKGAYARAYTGGEIGGVTQTPTISAVGYNSLLTSTWANKHNVWNNDITNPNYNYWNIFRIAKNHSKAIKTAIFSSWEDNRTKLVGEGLKEAGMIYIDEVLDGLENDRFNFPPEPHDLHIFKVDEEISKAAASCIKEKAPDLMWVYLWYMDAAGHEYGDSKEFDSFLELADIQVGRIWNAVKEREKKHNEEWMVVITTDHGRTESDGRGHGGQSKRERTIWISTNQQVNSYFKTRLPSITDIAPSICRFMDIKIPDNIDYEQEGVPFLGKISISDLKAKKAGNKIELSWKGYSDETVEIFLSTTNNFKNGKADIWKSAGKENAMTEKFIYEIADENKSFYKFSVRGKNNNLPVWIVNN